MILRGSLTSRTHRTPRLVSAGVEIVLVGAVQTLSGVLGWRGASLTPHTGGLVIRVTETIQEVAGGTPEPLCAGPGSLRTLETVLGDVIEDMVGQTAVKTLGGVTGAGPQSVLTAYEAARVVEAGLSQRTD